MPAVSHQRAPESRHPDPDVTCLQG